MNRTLTVFFTVGTLCVSIYAASLKELEQIRLFDADFMSMWLAKTADAQFAKGSPKATVKNAQRPLFDEETTESICHGIRIGEGCPSVVYETEGNFGKTEGTFELVLENREWEATDKGTYVWINCLSKDSTLYIYKHGNDGCGVYLGSKEPKWSCFPRVAPAKFPPKGRHHLAFTYSPTEIRLYIDGNYVNGAKPESEIKGWGKTFEIGTVGKWGADSHTTICRFTTYDRPLEGKEIRLLAANRLPHLKIDESTAIDKVVIPPSRLLRQTERLGLEALEPDHVPSPFTPVVREGNIIKVWNREYDFGGNAILKAVTSGGKPLMAAPVELVGTMNGTPFSIQCAPFSKLDVDAKGRKTFTREITAPAGVSGKVTTTIEYDGAVRFDVETKGLEKTDSLSLRVAMAKEFADAVHYTGTTGYKLGSVVSPDTSYSIMLPNDKTGVLLERPFCTHTWLGGSDGGIELFHDSDQAFWPKDRNDCMAWIREQGKPAAMLMRYVPEGEKAPEGGLGKFSFGLIATPVRPLPRGWRAWTISAQYDIFQGDTRGKLLVYWPDGWKAQMSLDPDPERALDRTKTPLTVKEDHSNGKKVIPYWDHRAVGIRRNNASNPDDEFLRANFQPRPARKDSGGPFEVVRVHSASGYTDYLLRCVSAWGRVFGHLDGAYIDEMENVQNDDEHTGGGYLLPNGERRITYSIYSDRDMYKRLDAVIRKQTDGADPSSIAHCSGMVMMELLSHFPVMLTGEHLFSGYFPHRKDLLPPEDDRLYYYSYSLPMDRVRAEFYHKPWGIVMAYLPCLKNQRDIMERPEPTRDLLSRLMHADVLFWPLWCNQPEMYKFEKFRREFDIGNDSVTFTPFWENNAITCDAKDSCISFYKRDNAYLVIVSNLSRSEATFKVTLPKEVSGARNAEDYTPIDLKDNTISITIPRNDYRAIRLF